MRLACDTLQALHHAGGGGPHASDLLAGLLLPILLYSVQPERPQADPAICIGRRIHSTPLSIGMARSASPDVMQKRLFHAVTQLRSLEKIDSDWRHEIVSRAKKRYVQVIWWQVFSKKYAEEIEAETEVFSGEVGSKRKADLRSRVTEHNILVIAKYYSRLQLSRLAQLLDLPAEEVRAQTQIMEGHSVGSRPKGRM